MSQTSDVYPVRTTETELQLGIIKFVGGSGAVTQVKIGSPNPITITYISTGIVEVTFPASINYVDILGDNFSATTASAVAGYTVNTGVYNSTTRKVRLSIYANSSGTPTLTDLAALQWLAVTFMWKTVTSV